MVILFISHAPSANTTALRDAAQARISAESDVELIVKPPLEATAQDALKADGILIGTTENIGYMAGLTKDYFDRCYNDLLDNSAGKPVAVYIRAGLDGTGTQRALEAIFTGLRWRLIAEPLVLKGEWRADFNNDAAELALGLAKGVEIGAF